MAQAVWKETFTDSAYNTAIVATAKEAIISTKENRAFHAPFNRLLIHNRDTVDIKINLDGLASAGKIFELSAGETILIEPEDGVTFDFLTQTNLDAAAAETANKILFRWAKCERVL